MNEHINFDISATELFSDTEARTISGIAVPTNATANKGGRIWRFAQGSVKFGSRTPLLAYHDTSRPVGKLTDSQWTSEGLRVKFQVSKTPLGDEMLQLAADQVLGLSVGIDVTTAEQVGKEFQVSDAFSKEISLTPTPAFAGARIEHVALSAADERTDLVPETLDAAPVAVQLTADDIGKAVALHFPQGPVTQPIPIAKVTEEAPYRFDGVGGKHGFVADMVSQSQGFGDAAQRLETFLSETFAIATTNVTPINPPTIRPDLWVGPLQYTSPLSRAITTGTLADQTPFIFPKFVSTGNLVNPHVQGTEPSLATFVATTQTVTPGALSGKAELNREVWDAKGNPAVDQLVWSQMLAASAEAREERIATMLDAITTTAIDIVGTGAGAVDSIKAELGHLNYVRGGNRYSSLVLNEALFSALVGAKDDQNRPLLPMISPSNADGQVNNSVSYVQVGNATGVPAWGLTDNSYLLVPSSVYSWVSSPQKLVFDIQVKSVFIGFWQYAAEAVFRDADVIPVTYATS